MNRIVFLLLLFVPICGFAQYSELPTIEIGLQSTTHVVFTSDLKYVDISNPEVIKAKVVDASKNMLALKAKMEFEYVTTISALEANGTMHTFRVVYREFPENLVLDTRNGYCDSSSGLNTQHRPAADVSVTVQGPDGQSDVVASQPASSPSAPAVTVVPGSPAVTVVSPSDHSGHNLNVSGDGASNFGRADAPTLEEVMAMPQQLYHIGAKSFKVEVYCSNIYVYSDLLYIVLDIYNDSDIGYETGDAQFTIRNFAKNNSDDLQTDKSVWPRSSYGTLSCPPRSQSRVVYTVPKFTLLKQETLRIYIYEKKGTRNIMLTLVDKDVNYAVSPR